MVQNDIVKITDFGEEAQGTIKRALEQAKKENRAKIVGHDYDDQNFIDDAVDWYQGTDLKDIFATVFPDGTIKRGFVNLDENDPN